jgi:hypothetical protein
MALGLAVPPTLLAGIDDVFEWTSRCRVCPKGGVFAGAAMTADFWGGCTVQA